MNHNRWWIAVKPSALPKIVLPMGLGLALGTDYRPEIVLNSVVLPLALLYALHLHTAIVLLNDYGDREADARHQRVFPQLFDKRVIPSGLIPAPKVLLAGGIAAAGVVLIACVIAEICNRPAATLLAVASVALVWFYSYSPARLNYLGGGESLEALGTGGLLPLTGFYFVVGQLDAYPVWLMVLIGCYALVGALASGLKHEPADRLNGKYTVTVIWGSACVHRSILALQLLAAGFALGGWCLLWYRWFLLPLGVFFPLLLALVSWRTREDFRDPVGLSRYKRHLSYATYSNFTGLLLTFLLPA